MNTSRSDARRARLYLALASTFVTSQAFALTVLNPGESATVAATDTPNAWFLQGAATNRTGLTLLDNARANGIESYFGDVDIRQGARVEATDIALFLGESTVATIVGATVVSQASRALVIANTSNAPNAPGATVSVTRSSIQGLTYGVSVSAAGHLVLDETTVTASGVFDTPPLLTGIGAGVFNGGLDVTNGSSITGQYAGLLLRKDERISAGDVGRNVTIDRSTVEGVDGPGIMIESRNASVNDANVVVIRNGSTLKGNGTAIVAGENSFGDITVSRSTVVGDIVTTGTGALNVALNDMSRLDGAMNGTIAATLTSDATWQMNAPSEIASLDLSGATVAFAPTGDASRHTLTIRGDFGGSGGAVALNTVLNQGGALAEQISDRLLIEGDVTTSGPTRLVVTGSGNGGLTDTNRNGIVEPNEGISLVQVAGTSRADAFALQGDYVAAGAFKYTLHAFGPGQVDQAQNALANGAPLAWDYRLGNSYVCEHDCDPVEPPIDPPVDPGVPPVDPPVEPPVDPGPGEGERLEVVPQLASYLSAPAALLTYGDMLNDGLHQRLGELRSGTSSDPVGGEVFARYLGGQLRYTSNLSFTRFGYDFDQQVNALQLGGSVIALDGDNGSLRAGWAADHGTTRVTPKAVDGDSSAKYRANGMSAWITWQHGSGLWVDGVVGSTRFRGDVGTDARGADVGRIRANGWTMSVEAGMPLAIGGDWTVEPRFQLKHQQLNFRNFTDVDGLLVRLGTAKQTSARIGAQVARTTNVRLMPYASLDLTHTSNGDPAADVSNAEWNVADRFGSGRVGNAYRFAAGAVSQLTDHVQVYGQGTYQHFVGSYGMRGWSGNLGVRVTF